MVSQDLTERAEAFRKGDAVVKEIDAVRADPTLSDTERTVKIAALEQEVAHWRGISGPRHNIAVLGGPPNGRRLVAVRATDIDGNELPPE